MKVNQVLLHVVLILQLNHLMSGFLWFAQKVACLPCTAVDHTLFCKMNTLYSGSVKWRWESECKIHVCIWAMTTVHNSSVLRLLCWNHLLKMKLFHNMFWPRKVYRHTNLLTEDEFCMETQEFSKLTLLL